MLLPRIASGVAALAVGVWALGRRRWRRRDGSQSDASSRGVRLTGSSVNLPDMSAALQAKVAVSDAVQADPAALAAAYDRMADKFAAEGLNLAAVEAFGQYFEGVADPRIASPQPLAYSQFPSPLPTGAVRLCLVFLQRANPLLAELVHAAAREVAAALPPGTQVYLNDPAHYHITVYMTSHLHCLRPDPFDPVAAPLPADLLAGKLAAAAQPSPETLQREIEAMRAAAAAAPTPAFAVHRLLLAESGTLLLCSVDRSGQVARLRKALRQAFPGGPPRQSTIYHASVARLLTPRQLGAAAVARVQEACDRWTRRLQGLAFETQHLYHVQEQRFTTVEGPTVALPFLRSSAPEPVAS